MITFVPLPGLLASPRGRDWPLLPAAIPAERPAAPLDGRTFAPQRY